MAKRAVFSDGAEEISKIDPAEINAAIEARARQLAAAPEFEDQLLDEEEDADELRALQEIDGASDCNFTVTRLLPAAQKGYVGTLSASEVTMERIQEEWGKGRYRIRGVRANGTFAGQRTIDISTDKKKPEPPPTPQHNSLQEYLALQEAKNAERREDMKQWATILAPVITAVLPAMLGRSNNAPTLTEMTQMMLNLKAMNPEPKSATSQIQDLAAMVNVIKEMQGEKEPVGSSWADIARDGIKEIGPLVGALVTAKSGTPTAVAPAVPSISSPEKNPAKPTPQIGDPMMQLLNWFRGQLETLVRQASLNKNPELYAEVLLDNIPPGTDPKMLLGLLVTPQWWTQLQQFYPAVSSYPQWFAECRAVIVEQLSESLRSVEPQRAAPPMSEADNDE